MTADSNDPHAGQAGDQTVVVPVVEERVVAGKRPSDGQTISITTRPITERVTVAEQLSREDISVAHVPIGRVVDEHPAIREEGDVTIIPVVEERLRVVVELVLREEVHIRRTKHVVTERKEVELTRTQVDIDRSRSGQD